MIKLFLFISTLFALIALAACSQSPVPTVGDASSTGSVASAGSQDSGAAVNAADGTVGDAGNSAETSDQDGDTNAAEISVQRKIVTGATKVTKISTSTSYTLTLTGPMTLGVGENGHFDLVIDATGPVKGISPKITFALTQLGTKGLHTPLLVDGAVALTYKLTGIVPAALGKWRLTIDVKDQDGADFDIQAQ